MQTQEKSSTVGPSGSSHLEGKEATEDAANNSEGEEGGNNVQMSDAPSGNPDGWAQDSASREPDDKSQEGKKGNDSGAGSDSSPAGWGQAAPPRGLPAKEEP